MNSVLVKETVLEKESQDCKERSSILLRLALAGRVKGTEGVESLLDELDRGYACSQ